MLPPVVVQPVLPLAYEKKFRCWRSQKEYFINQRGLESDSLNVILLMLPVIPVSYLEGGRIIFGLCSIVIQYLRELNT